MKTSFLVNKWYLRTKVRRKDLTEIGLIKGVEDGHYVIDGYVGEQRTEGIRATSWFTKAHLFPSLEALRLGIEQVDFGRDWTSYDHLNWCAEKLAEEVEGRATESTDAAEAEEVTQ